MYMHQSCMLINTFTTYGVHWSDIKLIYVTDLLGGEHRQTHSHSPQLKIELADIIKRMELAETEHTVGNIVHVDVKHITDIHNYQPPIE